MVASGSPAPTFSNTAFTGCTPSTLPSLVTFSDAGVLSGTPARYGGQLHGVRGRFQRGDTQRHPGLHLDGEPGIDGHEPDSEQHHPVAGRAFTFVVIKGTGLYPTQGASSNATATGPVAAFWSRWPLEGLLLLVVVLEDGHR